MKFGNEPVVERRDSGFILATVLVFLIVLSLTAFLGARLTRTDIQAVNNLQNEKEALTIAEAGVHEALYRLNLPPGDRATVSGVSGGAFNAAITPNTADSAWTTKVLFQTSAPSTSGSTTLAPSLQPSSSSQLQYTTTSNTSDALSVSWDLCTSTSGSGCSSYTVSSPWRQLPASSPRKVVKITSTGQSGTARRTLVVKAVDCTDENVAGPGSITSLGRTCSQGISLNGGNSITAAGLVTVNAGANSNPPSSCTSAATGGSTSNITAQAVNTVGVTSGNFTPAASTGSLAVDDPYADPLMRPPCFTGGPTPCQGTSPSIQHGTAASPSRLTITTNGTTLNPGIYYGGLTISATDVHLNPGVYIMAGGGFKSSTGTTSVYSNTSGGDGSGGVMIFNTQDPSVTTGAGAIDNIDLSQGNCTANIVAPTSGTWAGVVVYQDRRSTVSQPTIIISGGNSTRVLDGLVYAPLADFSVQGGSPSGTLVGGSLVVNSVGMTGNSALIVQAPSTNPPTPNCSGIAYVPIGWQDF